MDDEGSNQVPTFSAAPLSERKTIVAKKDVKVVYPSLIPESLMNDDFLNSLINSSLPKNYNFEIHKTLWKIDQTNSRTVLLQLPEGLIRFGPVLVDIMESYFKGRRHQKVKFIIMGDLTYGACCVDDYLASSMGCNLVVHYAHSCLVPISQLKGDVKYLYVFLDIKFDLEHIINCIVHNFNSQYHHIAMASTIQFVSSVHESAKKLRQLGFRITLPQSKPLSSSEVLGCTAPKLDSDVNAIVFICDGRFHLEALMIANPNIKAYRYDPYSRKMTLEHYTFDEMYDLRMSAIDKAVETLRTGGNFGFVLGTLGRQGNEKVFDNLVQKLKRTNGKCSSVKIMMPEVLHPNLRAFDYIDVWVQVACPRLSIDWGSYFDKPLLNPYEFVTTLKRYIKPDIADFKHYPMDFYAKNSCGDHTPNHSCSNNSSCHCQTNQESLRGETDAFN